MVKFTEDQDGSDPHLSSLAEWEKYLSDTRLSFFVEFLQLAIDRGVELNHKRIADFGSGTGYLLRLIDRKFPDAELVGFDSFVEVNQLAKMICPAATYHEDFDTHNELFDVIFCTEVLEHLKDPRARVHKLETKLKPHGQLVLKVPNGRTDTHDCKQPREDGTAYWGHVHFWSPESWPWFLQDALEDRADVQTGELPSGGNFAIVTMRV